MVPPLSNRRVLITVVSAAGLVAFSWWAWVTRGKVRERRLKRLKRAMERRFKSISHEIQGSDKRALERAVEELVQTEADYRKKGLAEVPAEVFVMESLTSLNLAENQLETLPAGIGQLTNLTDLNLMNNRLSELPLAIGELVQLHRLGLKSNRLTVLPSSLGAASSLVELYLTDNALESLPPEIGQLRQLRKLQASFNRLRSLPAEMADMSSLELFRVAVNPELGHIPSRFGAAPSLCWLSLAGSHYCQRAGESGNTRLKDIVEVLEGEYTLGDYLGSGASGDVYKGVHGGKERAIKIFRADVSPDGRCVDELEILCSLDHPNITRVTAVIGGGVNGSAVGKGVVMGLVKGRPLAEKPNFQSVLRCRWPPGLVLHTVVVARIAADVASALEYLHERGISHGDVYAHNVIVDLEGGGKSTLCDFGASFFYPRQQEGEVDFEALEVRAYGLYLQDLVRHADSDEATVVEEMRALAERCLLPMVSERPRFKEVSRALSDIAGRLE